MTKEQIERNRIRYGEVYDKPDGGDILGFPMPVIEAMLRYQENQGNPRNITIFKNRKWTSKNSGGFDWKTTKEGDEFWDDVILRENFDVFFEKVNKTDIVLSEIISDKSQDSLLIGFNIIGDSKGNPTREPLD